MRIIIFSLSFIVLLLSTAIYLTYDTNPAYAQEKILLSENIIEEGSNFKKELLSTDGINQTIKWTSKIPQVFDGNNWINYVYNDNPTYIRFESEGIAIDFFKDTCSFKLYEKGLIASKEAVIESLSHTITRDGNNIITTCNVSPITTTSDSISFDTISSDGITKVVTKYIINYISGIEWTFEPENLDIKDSSISITDSCYKCIPDKIEGDLVFFGNYVYNTKNNEIDPLTGLNVGHKTLTEQKTIGEDFIFKYETIVKPDEIIIIDPTFGYTAGTTFRIDANTQTGASCGSPNTKNSAVMNLFIGDSDEVQTCYRSTAYWDITSIPDYALITDTVLRYDITSLPLGSAKNCDVWSMEGNPSTQTATQIWNDAADGTEFINNDSGCTTVTNDKILDLGSSADTDVQNELATDNEWAVGWKYDSEVRDSSSHHQAVFGTIELQVVYNTVFSAGPPINPAATNNQVQQINFTWTTNNATGVTGYAIFNSSSTNILTNTWQSLANTANFTGDTGFYLHTGLNNQSGSFQNAVTMYYKASAIAVNNGTNSTIVAGFTAGNATSPSLIATTYDQTRIDFISTAGSSNGNSTVKDYGLQCEKNHTGGWLNTVNNSTLPANRAYNYTGLSGGDYVTCQWKDGNSVGWSNWSTNASSTTFQNLNASITFAINKTGDAIEAIPLVRLTAGIPNPTVTNIQILRNGTSINNTAISYPITVGQTISLGRTFLEQLDANYVYNITARVSITNTTGTYPFTNSTIEPIVYTGSYFTSSEGNYQVNYTHSRTNSYQNLNLAVNRQNLPVNTECAFKDELFEVGTWVNETNSGWYNQSVTVVPTKDIYVTCYNDQLLFSFTSSGGNNATLAFVDYMHQLGTFAGVPVPFIFIILLAAVFTGRSAITGIIFVAITIGVMGTMGFLPDINGNPSIAAATWGFIVLLTAVGVFAGKKYF